MGVSAIKAGQAFIEIGARDKALRDSLKANETRMRNFVGNVAKVGAALVITGAATALKQFANLGDQFDKMSARTGFSVKALSELKFAAEQTGSGIGALSTGIKGMSRLMLDAERGLKTATDTLDDLGIKFSELEHLAPDQRLERFADAIAKVEDPSRRSALAMKVFGRSGVDLLPLLKSGSQGMRELRKEASALGLTMTDEQAAAAAELTDAWNRVIRTLEATVVKLGAELAPAMTNIANMVANVVAGNHEWIVVLAKMAAVVAAAATAMKVLTVAMTLYAKKAVIAQALSGPKGWFTLAVGAAAATAALGVLSSELEGVGVASDTASSRTAELSSAINDLSVPEQVAAAADALGSLSTEADKQAVAMINAGFAASENEKAIGNAARAASLYRDAAKASSKFIDDARGRIQQHTAAMERQSKMYSALKANATSFAENTKSVSALMDQQATSTEKLSDKLKLLESRKRRLHDARHQGGGIREETFRYGEVDDLRDRLIDSATGFSKELRRVQDEIAKLNGGLTESDIKLREMAKNFLPTDKIEELRKEYAALEQLHAQQKADKEQADVQKQEDQDRKNYAESLQARADEIRDALKTPAEHFTDLVDEMKELVKAGTLDRSEATAFLSKRQDEAKEGLQQRHQDAANRVVSESSQDLRSSAGNRMITQLLNRTKPIEQRMLTAENRTAANTKNIASLLEDRKQANI